MSIDRQNLAVTPDNGKCWEKSGAAQLLILKINGGSSVDC